MKLNTLLFFALLANTSFASSFGVLNDDCSSAMELTIGETHVQSLCGASMATQQPVELELEIFDVWLKITADSNEALTLTTNNLDNEAYGLSIYEGDDCGMFNSENYVGPVQNELGINFHENFELTEGQVFYVQIWSDFQSCANVEVSLESPVLGCTEYCNMNYNPAATLDDGTCLFAYEFGMYCEEAEELTYDPIAAELRSINAEFTFPCYMPNAPDAESWPVNGGVYFKFDGNGGVSTVLTCDNLGTTEFHVYKQLTSCGGELEYIGRSIPSTQNCPNASNPQQFTFLSELGVTYLLYLSTWDDDGLEHTDYSSESNIQLISGSEADLNLDGMVSSDDLLFFLSYFTCMGTDCEADLNNDGIVNTIDLLDFLSNFGG